jgi:hypothetical protein
MIKDSYGTIATPPEDMVVLAVRIAYKAPCKRRGGAIVFEFVETMTDRSDIVEVVPHALAYSGPPMGHVCDSQLCARLCLHAEERAMRYAFAVLGGPNGRNRTPRALELLVVSVGEIDPLYGPGPSCMECARTLLDEQITGVWFYEREHRNAACRLSDHTHERTMASGRRICPYCNGDRCMRCPDARGGPHEDCCSCEPIDAHEGLPPIATVWRRYTADEYYLATRQACA